MKKKILKYIQNCWDHYRCADKDEVKRIVKEIIQEHPKETNYTKLGMHAKRRCQAELTK